MLKIEVSSCYYSITIMMILPQLFALLALFSLAGGKLEHQR